MYACTFYIYSISAAGAESIFGEKTEKHPLTRYFVVLLSALWRK